MKKLLSKPASSTAAVPPIQWIRAHENNLRFINLTIPSNALVSFAGVSGSGKSSLLEDCLAAEATRRHRVLARTTPTIATPYAPLVDDIVSPYVMFVRQGVLAFNPRSTVGTASGILQPLRQVLARSAHVCGADGQRLAPLTLATVIAWHGLHRAQDDTFVLARLGVRVLGPLRARIDAALADTPHFTVVAPETGVPFSPEDAKPASSFRRSVVATQRDVYAVFVVPRHAPASAFQSALESAARIAGGFEGVRLHIKVKDGTDEILDLADILLTSGESTVYRRPSVTLLSFNSRLPNSGRCLICDGLGVADVISLDGLIADARAPLAEGGLRIPYDSAQQRYKYIVPLSDEIRGLLVAHGLLRSASWGDLTDSARAELLHGSGKRVIRPLRHDGTLHGKPKPFRGLIPQIEEKLKGASPAASVLADLRERGPCNECGGTRLAHAARAVEFGGRGYGQILAMSIGELGGWLRTAATQAAEPDERQVLQALAQLAEGCTRLGLGHLALDRSVTTLSGGEGQRLRIAAAVSTPMTRVCYALDEPSRGLHPVDAKHLVSVLRQLVAAGTTVLVAEHNRTVIAASDHVVELGPGGGSTGGQVVYSGPAASAPFLQVKAVTRRSALSKSAGRITVSGITLRTLRNQQITLPLGGITAIAGVSGSGKTTLVRDVLLPALTRFAETGATDGPFHHKFKVTGGRFERVVYVSQQALANNPRSSVLTKLELGTSLRDWFFRGSQAEALGLSLESLNPNSAAGSCRSCEGTGRMARGGAPGERCSACGGSRLAPAGLWARLDNRTIAEWLEITLDDLALTPSVPEVLCAAASLCVQLGLGHLSLGRSLPTLSGGEAQRLRIAEALLKARRHSSKVPHQIFVMDEPAAGLHPLDVVRLQAAFDAIVADGANTVLLIEHNVDLIRNADWVIDLGPGAAEAGGRVLWCGAVPDFLTADLPESRTRSVLLAEPSAEPIVGGTAAVPPSPDEEHPRDVVQRFRAALAAAAGDEDPDEEAHPARPAYVVSAGDGTAHGQHGVLSLLGCALPLYRAFARASSVPGQPLLDEADVVSAALEWCARRQHVRVGWHPLVAGAQHEIVIDDDLREALRSGRDSGAHAWYDGRSIQERFALRAGALDLRRVRFLLDPELDRKEAVARAITLGQGWISIVDVGDGTLGDFTSRVVDIACMRLGQRRFTPQVFDPLIEETACLLCRGKGVRTVVDQELVVRDARFSLDDDRLFTALGLEALRSARRKRMVPALSRLERAGVIDLSGPVDKMSADQRIALWFGFPDRKFLRPGGDPSILGDWFRFRGLYKHVLDEMWAVSERDWSRRVETSQREVPCPRCEGTGLGWEATARQIDGVSLRTLKVEFNLARLRHWLAGLRLSAEARPDVASVIVRLDAALRCDLGHVQCGARLSELSEIDRFRLFTAACVRHELSGALALVAPPSEMAPRDTAALLDGLNVASRMDWVLDP